MSASTVASAASNTPWLEHFLEQDGPAQKTVITSFPFTIGRNDTADLPIKSTRVSREHAVIVRAADTFRIRDLDSTNGTFLNGERIEEATLNDGDILLIADVEFTFFSGAAQAPRKTVTQVISFRDSKSAQPKCLDIIRSVRRLHESLLHGGYTAIQRPVMELGTGKAVGCECLAGPLPVAAAEAERMVLAAHARLAARLREVFCITAAELSLHRPGQKLFLPLESSEMDLTSLDGVVSALKTVLPDLRNVVFEVPDSDVNDVAYFHRWYARVRDSGASLCYRDFAAGRARLEEHRRTPPDYIKLSPAMARGVGHDTKGRAACEALLRACRELDCQAIAVGIDTPQQAELFHDLGCPLGQGKACQDVSPVRYPAAQHPPRQDLAREAVLCR